jgi:trehalose 6-phosphate phosphatase
LKPWRPEVPALVRARRHLHLFVDFDGTITPIAPTPEAAELSARGRLVLEQLVRRPQTRVAVVSGRPVETLARKVAVEGVIYVGNHGMETLVYDVRSEDPVATRARPIVARLGARFAELAARSPGAVLEQKGISLSLHTRLLAPDEARAVEADAVELASGEEELAVFTGKRVVEVRPRGAPDKGLAALRLLESSHGQGWEAACAAIFIGDDQTDEDGFRALAGRGAGVRVRDEHTGESAAGYFTDGVDDTLTLLESLL